MARERSGKGRKTERKEVKNQGLKFVGEVIKCDSFGDDDKHSWFILKEEQTNYNYMMKNFNTSDETWKILCDADKVEVLFNIGFVKYKGEYQQQLIAYEIKEVK